MNSINYYVIKTTDDKSRGLSKVQRFKQMVEPLYFQSFYCEGSSCQDSCCVGWDVAIDKETYEKYQRCPDMVLSPLFHKHVILNHKTVGTSQYAPHALVQMEQYVCPFLTDEKLCLIQKRLDEQFLSLTCATYPRVFNSIEGVLERSLCVSCPKAAEIVLLDRRPMQFQSSEIDDLSREYRITDVDDFNSVGQCGNEIRCFTINLLQDRTYTLWERLIILGVFCNRLEQVTSQNSSENILELLEYFRVKIQSRDFCDAMRSYTTDIETQLQVVKIFIEHRLGGAFVGDRFKECVRDFHCGIGLENNAPLELVDGKYLNACNTFYNSFMEKNEHILENYLVNYAFKNIFPFGSLRHGHETNGLYTEYVVIVIHYFMIKTLLIGMAGCYKSQFGCEHVVKLVQAYSKTFEHDFLFHQQAVTFIKAAGMYNTGGMSMLIKN